MESIVELRSGTILNSAPRETGKFPNAAAGPFLSLKSRAIAKGALGDILGGFFTVGAFWKFF